MYLLFGRGYWHNMSYPSSHSIVAKTLNQLRSEYKYMSLHNSKAIELYIMGFF